MRLTREQLDQYDEDGYDIVPDFLSAEEVGVLAADADILGTPRRGLPEGNVYEKNSGLIRKSCSFEKDFESFHLLTRLPRMLAPARQILGEDIYLYMTHMNHKIHTLAVVTVSSLSAARNRVSLTAKRLLSHRPRT